MKLKEIHNRAPGCIWVPVLLIVIVIGVSIEDSTKERKRKEEQSAEAGFSTFIQAKGDFPVATPVAGTTPRIGPMLVISRNQVGKPPSLATRIHFALPSSMRAKKTSDVVTIVWVDDVPLNVGDVFSTSHGEPYQRIKLRVIDSESRVLIEEWEWNVSSHKADELIAERLVKLYPR